MKKVLFIAAVFLATTSFAQTLNPPHVDKFDGTSFTTTSNENLNDENTLSAHALFSKDDSVGILTFSYSADGYSTFDEKKYAYLKLGNGEVIKLPFLGELKIYPKGEMIHFGIVVSLLDLKRIIANKVTDIRFKSEESYNDFSLNLAKNMLPNICKLVCNYFKV